MPLLNTESTVTNQINAAAAAAANSVVQYLYLMHACVLISNFLKQLKRTYYCSLLLHCRLATPAHTAKPSSLSIFVTVVWTQACTTKLAGTSEAIITLLLIVHRSDTHVSPAAAWSDRKQKASLHQADRLADGLYT